MPSRFTDEELAAFAQRGKLNSETDLRWLATVASLQAQVRELQAALARTKRGGRKRGTAPSRTTVWRDKRKAEE